MTHTWTLYVIARDAVGTPIDASETRTLDEAKDITFEEGGGRMPVLTFTLPAHIAEPMDPITQYIRACRDGNWMGDFGIRTISRDGNYMFQCLEVPEYWQRLLIVPRNGTAQDTDELIRE